MVRAKFRVTEKTQHQSGFIVKLQAVYDDNPDSENGKFFKYTPSGEIVLQTLNEAAADEFIVDRQYYVDFSLAAVLEATS